MSRILERANALDWERVKEQGGRTRLYQSAWIITTLQRYLPPEHVALAQRLAKHQATVEGCRVMDAKVDCAGNSAAIALDARLDAMRALEGYVQAALTRVGSDGALCTRAIANSDHMAEAMRRCGYPAGSKGAMKRLVQLTLVKLDEYEEENRAGPFDADASWRNQDDGRLTREPEIGSFHVSSASRAQAHPCGALALGGPP